MEVNYILTNDRNLLVSLSVIIFLAITFSTGANITVLVAIVQSRKKGLHNSITKLLIASMSTSDLLLTLLVAPPLAIVVMNNGHWTLGDLFCSAWLDVSLVVSTIGAWNVLSMAVDKYLAVCKPLLYRLLSNKSGVVMILLSWFIPASALFLSKINDARTYPNQGHSTLKMSQFCLANYSPQFFTSYITLTFLLPLTITYILYVLIYLEIRSFIKRMSEFTIRYNASNKWESKSCSEFETSLSTPSTVRRISHLSIDTLETNSQKSSPRVISRIPKPLRKQTKAVVTIGSIVAVFTIFWMPPSLYFTVASQSLTFEELDKNSTSFVIPSTPVVYDDGWLISGSYMFSLLPAIINPFLYCGIKSVRVKVLSLLCGPQH